MIEPRTLSARGEVFEGASRLSPENLNRFADEASEQLRQILNNAAYWVAFDMAQFEPLLAYAPPVVRDLGVGVLLAFGEHPAGYLELRDLAAARSALQSLPEELSTALHAGVTTLHRAVSTRDRLPNKELERFREVQSKGGLAAFTLQSSSTAVISVQGHPAKGKLKVELGVPVRVSATDERGRSLPPPDVENALGAPFWRADSSDGGRDILLAIPGTYILQVPGHSGGARTLVAC